MEEENRKSLTLFGANESRYNMMFKHYETLHSYHTAFTNLIEKTKEYREQERFEAKWTLSTREL